MGRFREIVMAAALCLMVGSRSVAGPRWEVGEDGYLSLGLLGQVQGAYTDDGSGSTDLFLRRARIILNGQIADGVRFFVETDNDNAGRRGTSDIRTDIQDAFVDIRIADTDHWLQAGLILLPFSFENHSSAASLLGLDYNAEVIKLVNTFVWRDCGAALHGHFGDRLSYYAGVFDGYDDPAGSKNPDAAPRFTGHVAFNFLGAAETGWFFAQDRQGLSGNYLSIGAGIDRQDDATLCPADSDGAMGSSDTAPAPRTVSRDSQAWVVDWQSGFNLGPTVLTVNGAYYEWDHADFEGSTAFVESGLMFRKTMVTAKYTVQNPDEGASLSDYTAGLHYFTNGHRMRGGVEYRWGDRDDFLLFGLQFML